MLESIPAKIYKNTFRILGIVTTGPLDSTEKLRINAYYNGFRNTYQHISTHINTTETDPVNIMTEALRHLKVVAAAQGLQCHIDTCDGDSWRFHQWIEHTEKYAFVPNLNDAQTTKTKHIPCYSQGSVSVFVSRRIQEHS